MISATLRRRRAGRSVNSVRISTLTGVSILALILAGCRERMPDHTAVHLSDPAKRHLIHHATRTERLVVELAHSGAALDRGQRGDVRDFVAEYRRSGGGRIRVSRPVGARGHLASRTAVGQVEEIIERLGLPPGVLASGTMHRPHSSHYAIELSFDRPVAIAPTCGDWAKDLGKDRDVLPYNNFGCATQRNFALNTAYSRDLLAPQPLDPRSSQRRESQWEDYTSNKPDKEVNKAPSGVTQNK